MKFIFVLLLILLQSCMPETKVRTGALQNGNQTPTSPTAPVSDSDVELAWFQNLQSPLTITLFRDLAESVYVRGRRIENFLLSANAPTATYCIEFDMGNPLVNGDKQFLRVRATPMSVNNLVTRTRTVYLRVDFSNPTSNQSICSLPSQVNTVAHSLDTVRANATNQITSQGIRLYRRTFVNNQNVLTQVAQTQLDLNLIRLALQPGNAPVVGGTCSTETCRAIGFSCCLDNQCVRDGATKPDILSLPPTNSTYLSYLQAEQAKISNPLAFLSYPQFYYICGTNQNNPTTGGSTGGSTTDPNAEAAARLLQLQKDYACIQMLKEKSQATPFHGQIFNPSAIYDQNICRTTLAPEEQSNEANITDFYKNVINRLYNNCGCSSTFVTFDEKISNCPKYDYNVVSRNAQNQPIEFACTAIDESGVETPFQNLSVAVNSKSVPHRFFDSSGVEVNVPAANAAGTVVTQEGSPFRYLDQEKVQPLNGTFNMNSILGNFNLELSEAMPAKVIDLQVDNVYLIATRSGLFTPCPTCAKDSWFPGFSAHPTAAQGVGLQAVGHSTSRDSWDNNTTFGNYEDAIFGRACWVPPTMIPWTQPVAGEPGAGSAEAARVTRLRAQATLFMNGYQRDWYGFNKGALIGSFDGVTWFAIGKGRIIRSTTNKLFLAINAPFGDLTESNTHIVSVQAFEGQATAALLDFHPDLLQNHPNQNEAGNCQAYHRCDVDSDCITKLGWEYACADVSNIKSRLPDFEPIGAKERSNNKIVNVEGLLAQGTLPTGSNKRCVYRGAGALCRINADSISVTTDPEKRKLLTCAPNFWCASVDGNNHTIPGTSQRPNVWNAQVARFAAPLENLPVFNNHIFGQDANQLGRPLDYVHFEPPITGVTPRVRLVSTLDSNAALAIKRNAFEMDNSITGQEGICRPGKRLAHVTTTTDNRPTLWNPFNQHRNLDEFSRTDYTNQIASCPAAPLSVGLDKLTSCPVLDNNGNYVQHTTLFPAETRSTWIARAMTQNSCGYETLQNGATITAGMSANDIQTFSPFKNIEGRPLRDRVVVSAGLTRDACLRRAGAVCHTDLDCSPNKMHANEAQFFGDSFFGNRANREYYEQSLICGQERKKPFLSDENFFDYDMTKNRCCREVGSDITTYTAFTPRSTTDGDYTPETNNLNPIATGTSEPLNANRYERFIHIRNFPNVDRPPLNAYMNRVGNNLGFHDFVRNGIPLFPFANIETEKQWMTLNDANSLTCCGGGWMRKFSDGTVNWAKRDRLQLDVSNFRCLNYLSPLVTIENPQPLYGISRGLLDVEFDKYCLDPAGTNGNCAQISIAQGSYPPVADFNKRLANDLACTDHREMAPGVSPIFGVAIRSAFSTLGEEIPWNGAGEPNKWNFSGVDFPANLFSFFPPESADFNPNTEIDFSVTIPSGGRKNIYFFMPSYVGNSSLTVQMQRRDRDNEADIRTCAQYPIVENTFPSATRHQSTSSMVSSDGITFFNCPSDCCYSYDGNRRLYAVINRSSLFFQETKNGDPVPEAEAGRYGIKITYQAPGTGFGSVIAAEPNPTVPPTTRPMIKRSCSDIYYLDQLGKFELTGIPQITHEKLVCNNNLNRLVPGLYNIPDVNSAQTGRNIERFNNPNFGFLVPKVFPESPTWRTSYHGLAVDPIFSPQDFKCCTPSGKYTREPTACCSGRGVIDTEVGTLGGRPQYKCVVPSGANLSVYLNRFVSNEGTGDHLQSVPLNQDDFNVKTGEPLLTASVNSKIANIGREICESGEIRRGGAFGDFQAQPAPLVGSQPFYGILDSSSDNGTNSSGGGTDTVGYFDFMNGYRWNHHIYCR